MGVLLRGLPGPARVKRRFLPVRVIDKEIEIVPVIGRREHLEDGERRFRAGRGESFPAVLQQAVQRPADFPLADRVVGQVQQSPDEEHGEEDGDHGDEDELAPQLFDPALTHGRPPPCSGGRILPAPRR